MKHMTDMDPESVAKYMPGQHVEIGIGTDGKTVKRHLDILQQDPVPMTSECWGVYSHDLNNGKGKKYYYECWFLHYELGDCTGIRGIIDPFDPDNKYGPKFSGEMIDLKDTDPSNTAGTAATQATVNESRLSHIS